MTENQVDNRSIDFNTSILVSALATYRIDILNGGQLYDATLLSQQHYPQIEPTNPLLIFNLTDKNLAAALKETLLTAYPTAHPIMLIQPTASEPLTAKIALDRLDQQTNLDPQTLLYLPPLEKGGSFPALQEIVAHLRAPNGCPWDRKQTILTLREGLLNECFELLEALDVEEGGSDNLDNIVEELGDVLLLLTMMIQIAAEEGRFQMADVARGIVTKLIRRHPHVFDTVTVDSVDQVITNWDAIKAQEKADRGEKPRGPLDGVPEALPALEKARKLQTKAHKANLLDREALADSVELLLDTFHQEASTQSLGALLWAITALAKRHNLNAEDALRSHAVRFRKDAGEPKR